MLHVRNDGIKSFVRSVRQKDWGCYLLNQDYGPVCSKFTDFFATYKTLPITGRLSNSVGADNTACSGL
ncbi:UNVERIFIED_CONTAM: hypothetical protein QJA12_23720 [Escherichia coli]|uniref:LpxL/LpxP family acyltransferase n=1 Tax=Escherichia coli TaxID=562 RepID=UPI00180247FA|nr:hypothetical protein [Escherichia coli]EFH9011972.1 hypothetical protein [Escherichia coli]MDP4428739.1 hypothetical protein [Escherichia coli]UYC91720.1 hypothetical protein OEG87_23645 [Escherichia coli]